jgi:hypothetical protein
MRYDMKKIIITVLLVALLASPCFASGFAGRGISGSTTLIPTTSQDPVIVNSELRAIKYYNSAGTVTRVDIFFDSAVTDYGNADTAGSIAWALALFPTTQGAVGGMIHLGIGTFPVATKLLVNHTNIDIGGEGDSTQIYVSNGANLDAVFHYYSPDNTHKYYFFNIHDLHIEGNKAQQASGNNYGIWISVGSGGQANDYKIERVFIQSMKGACLQSDYTWGARIQNSLFESCGGDGVFLTGTGQAYLSNIYSQSNGGVGVNLNYLNRSVVNNITSETNVGNGLLLIGNNNTLTNISLLDNCTTPAGCASLYLAGGANNGKSKIYNIEIGVVSYQPAYGVLIQGADFEIDGMRVAGVGTTKDIYVDSGGTNTTIRNSKFTTYANTGTTNWFNNFPITIAAGTVDLPAFGTVYLNSAGGAITGTLPDATWVGQEVIIIMTNATASSTVSASHHETSDPEVCTFDAVGETWKLMWNGAKWITIKATCTL